MEDSFIVAGVFTYDHEAHIFAGRLESEGIRAFIDDNNIVAANPFLSNAVGGIKVRIYRTDLEKARAIFNEEHKEEAEQLSKPSLIKDGKEYVSMVGSCPDCDSSIVYAEKFKGFKWVISILVMGFVSAGLPPPYRTRMLCEDCEHSWKR